MENPFEEDAQKRVNALKRDNRLLENEIQSLREYIQRQNDFAKLRETHNNERVAILEKQLLEREQNVDIQSKTPKMTKKRKISVLMEERDTLLRRVERGLKDILEMSRFKDAIAEQLRIAQLETNTVTISMQHELDDKNLELAELNSELEKLQREKANQASLFQELLADSSHKLTQSNDAHAKELVMLELRKQKVISELQAKEKRLTNMVLELSQSNQIQREELSSFEARMQVVQDRNSQLEKQCTSLLVEASTLQEELTAERSKLNYKTQKNLEDKLAEFRVEIVQLREKLSDANTERKRLEQSNKLNRDSVIKLQRESEQMRRSQLTLEEDSAFLTIQKESLESRNKVLLAKIDELANTNHELEDKVNHLESEIQTLLDTQDENIQENIRIKVCSISSC
jgi:predicted  nucleic acid-binding Zn-ribbon protein